MLPVHAYASRPHYASHLLPIWEALAPEERGTFYAGSRDTWLELHAAGCPNLSTAPHRNIPKPAATMVDGHAPHWLTAAFVDMQRCGTRRQVLVEHGAGQSYLGDGRHPWDGGYSGGSGRRSVDLFICPNMAVAARNNASYPDAEVAVVGCPRLDRYAHVFWPDRAAVAGDRIAFTFHWEMEVVPEGRSALPHHRAGVEAYTRKIGMTALGHGHPLANLGGWWQSIGVEYAPHVDQVLQTAAVLVADNTSVMWEAAALDIPVVVLNAPWYRRGVEHGLRFWEHADVGIQVDDPGDIADAVADTLSHDPHRARRRQIGLEVYGAVGGAAQRAVRAMRGTLPS